MLVEDDIKVSSGKGKENSVIKIQGKIKERIIILALTKVVITKNLESFILPTFWVIFF